MGETSAKETGGVTGRGGAKKRKRAGE